MVIQRRVALDPSLPSPQVVARVATIEAIELQAKGCSVICMHSFWNKVQVLCLVQCSWVYWLVAWHMSAILGYWAFMLEVCIFVLDGIFLAKTFFQAAQ